MRKRVTFVEQLKKENIKNASGHILMRSAESHKKDTDGFESSQRGRPMCREAHINLSASSRHMKAFHVPKTLMSAPFLQHPALTAGQRRYLCSIANIYSTEHMRQQMKRHYLNVLHTCIPSGQDPACRRRYGDHQQKQKSKFTKDVEKDVSKAKPKQQSKSTCSSAYSDIILPKIVNR